MRIIRRSWVLAMLLGAAVACGDGGEAPVGVPEDAPEVVGTPGQPAGAVAPVADDGTDGAAEAAGASGEAAAETLEEQLAKPVSFDFAGVSAAEIPEMISMVCGAKIVVDPAIAAELENVPVTLKMSDVTALQALQTLARIIGGKKVDVREDAVWLTNP
jgi:hypothetical protein